MKYIVGVLLFSLVVSAVYALYLRADNARLTLQRDGNATALEVMTHERDSAIAQAEANARTAAAIQARQTQSCQRIRRVYAIEVRRDENGSAVGGDLLLDSLNGLYGADDANASGHPPDAAGL